MWKCPKCESTNLAVVIQVTANLIQDGKGENFETDYAGGDHAWDESSVMTCNACDHSGFAAQFDSESTHAAEEAAKHVCNESIVIGLGVLAMLIDMAKSHVEDIETGIADGTYDARDNPNLANKQSVIQVGEAAFFNAGKPIYAVLDLGTQYITEATCNGFKGDGWLSDTDHGVIFYVPEEDVPGENSNAVPADLDKVFRYAREHHCYMVRFDSDGGEVQGLPTYDW